MIVNGFDDDAIWSVQLFFNPIFEMTKGDERKKLLNVAIY
jgi:hypothetical protein